jgi:hypothetical protein
MFDSLMPLTPLRRSACRGGTRGVPASGRQIAELEAELAATRRANKLLKVAVPPKGPVRHHRHDGYRGTRDPGRRPGARSLRVRVLRPPVTASVCSCDAPRVANGRDHPDPRRLQRRFGAPRVHAELTLGREIRSATTRSRCSCTGPACESFPVCAGPGPGTRRPPSATWWSGPSPAPSPQARWNQIWSINPQSV